MCSIVRYNVSHLEQWVRDNRLNEATIHPALDQIIQASQLLQARKTNADVEAVCDMCSRLTTSQVENWWENLLKSNNSHRSQKQTYIKANVHNASGSLFVMKTEHDCQRDESENEPADKIALKHWEIDNW